MSILLNYMINFVTEHFKYQLLAISYYHRMAVIITAVHS